jgi:hypothetical protein
LLVRMEWSALPCLFPFWFFCPTESKRPPSFRSVDGWGDERRESTFSLFCALCLIDSRSTTRKRQSGHFLTNNCHGELAVGASVVVGSIARLASGLQKSGWREDLRKMD